MTAEPPIRVMIVDDHALFREGIATLLASYDDIAVVAAAGGVLEALERCGEVGADVIVIDLALPKVDGATGTALLRERYPHVRVVVLTSHADGRSVRAAIQGGASASLVKTVGIADLVDAIRGVTRGRSTFSSELVPQLVSQQREDHLRITLTAREHDILTLLAVGSTNKGIAYELGLTEGTVRVYVSAILTKLGVSNRTEATVMAIREGLVDQPP